MGRSPLVSLVLALALAVVGTGCGGGNNDTSSSEKPAYCNQRAALTSSANALKKDVQQGKFANLQGDAETVSTDASALVSSAKSDFPQETDALDSAVSKLSDTAKGLSAKPSPSELITIAPQVGDVVTSAKTLLDATRTKC